LSAAAKGAVLGLGALAIYQLSEPAAAADRGPVQSDAEPAAREGLASSPLCAAALDGELGATFGAELVRQCRALAAHYGGFSLPFVGTVPILPAACCVEWLERWLTALRSLHAAEPFRFNYSGRNYTVDVFTPISPTLAERLAGAAAIGGLSAAWREVVIDYAQAKAAGGANPYIHVGALVTRLRRLAEQMDRQARASLSPSAVEYAGRFFSWWGDTTRTIASTTGNALAWGIEELAAPVVGAATGATVGAATSALGPYLIIAGVGYLAWRKL
jgi:hypothetical protein